MYVTLGAAATALVMDPLLILGLDPGLHGVAIATVIVIVRIAIVLIGMHGLWRVHRLIARPDAALVLRELAPFMAIAMPVVLTQIATLVGNAFVTHAISSYGDEAIAGVIAFGLFGMWWCFRVVGHLGEKPGKDSRQA